MFGIFEPKHVKLASKIAKLTAKRVNLDEKIAKLKEKLLLSRSGNTPDLILVPDGKVAIKRTEQYLYDLTSIMRDIRQNKIKIEDLINVITLNPSKMHEIQAFRQYYKGLKSQLAALVYLRRVK